MLLVSRARSTPVTAVYIVSMQSLCLHACMRSRKREIWKEKDSLEVTLSWITLAANIVVLILWYIQTRLI